MAFLNPFFLLGLAAAAIPVLVHLVRRTRARRVQFASLMFLRRIEQRTVRKRKLRNLLLLAMRCAALLLLALAFARPYFPGKNSLAATTDRPSRVILLDASYSMRYPGVFERARQAARDHIQEAGAGEQIALVRFAQGYEVLMASKADRAEALALVDAAEPGLGSTDYLQAIQAADSLLKDAAASSRKIYLISDFQDAGWNRAASVVKLSEGVELVPVDVADDRPANVAITEVRAEPVIYSQKYPGKVTARISNFSVDAVNDAAVELKLNDLAVERRQIKLDPGESEIVEFAGFNVSDGSNRATVEVAGDEFTLDNRFFFTIKREPQARVLAIETASRGRGESFFIEQSLLAGDNSQYELVVKTAGSTNPAELDSYKAVIVNDAGSISDQLASAIKSFVERGGGLIIAAGKHVESSDFERAFSVIAPARLGETVQTRGGYALMSQIKTDHPIFNVFSRSGRLASTRVFAYHRAEPKEGASVLAALDDGSPVIVEGLAGSGKILLITTTLDTAWNDLPLTPMFLPFVRQMLEYLGGRAGVSSYQVGQVFAASMDSSGALPLVENPGGGRIEDARKNPSGELSINAEEIGFYRLRYSTRADHVAVNLDARESDLTKLAPEELLAVVSPASGGPESRAVPGDVLTSEEIEAKQQLWLPLLIAALALFVGEAVMARRIRLNRIVSGGT